MEDMMNRILGVTMIVLALVLAVAPVFTDCESHGRMLTTADGRSVSMKCHWTGIAEIAAAVPLGAAGIYALRGRRRETTRFAAIVGATSGATAVLLPTALIGTCMNPSMVCNLLMRPILLAAGILAITTSVALFAAAREPEMVAAQAVAL
jgi:hypothetical protein